MKQLFLILLSFFYITSHSQNISENQPLKLDKKKRNILLASEATLYTVSLVGLNKMWYEGYPRSSFHFINDNAEWLQMDKIGHATTSYYTGVLGIKAYKWTGMDSKKAIWFGGMTGSIFLTIIEILDGTSAEWGASSGDLIANTSGSLLAIGQELAWQEQRLQLKYSYSPSEWASQNPAQLGSNHIERALKDYNGQTYWLSINMKSMFNIQNNNFPSWLCLSLGYSGNGMLTPHKVNDDRSRQYLLSFDVDLTKVKTKSKTLNSVLQVFGYLKVPMPTIEFNQGKMIAHPIYY